MLIPESPIVVAAAFSATLPAPRVVAAIGKGLRAGGRAQPELVAITQEADSATGVRRLLEGVDFDARMTRARAVVVGERCLRQRTLSSSASFEIATRARQAGVPAYAVLAENALDSFDARILDLQVILEARTTPGLIAAGRKLATLI
jgi:glycerate 2-kinase